MSANLPPIPNTPPLGRIVYNPVGGSTIIHSEDPGAVTSGAQTRKFAVAARHPVVQQALRLKLSGPFWVDWNIVGQNDLKANPAFEYMEAAVVDAVTEMLTNLDFMDFTSCLQTSLQDGIVCGLALAELFWDERTAFGRQNLRSIKFYAPWQFDLEWDSNFNLSKIRHLRSGACAEGDKLSKFLVLPWPNNAHGNAYGISLLETIYEDVRLIRVLEAAQEEGVRAVMLKALLHHYAQADLNDDDLESLKADLMSLQSGSLISFQADFDKEGKFTPRHMIEVLESRADPEGLKLTESILERLYKRVNRVLGMPDDMGFTTTTVGSLAKAREEGTVYMQEIVSMQKWIEGWVNRNLIPLIMRYNFPTLTLGPFKQPRFAFDVVEEDVFARQMPAVKDALTLKIISPEEARSQIGFDGPPPEVAPLAADEPANFAAVGRRKGSDDETPKYVWRAHLDEESCQTCRDRDGSIATEAEWDNRGRPKGLKANGNPATECGDNCRCKLERTI